MSDNRNYIERGEGKTSDDYNVVFKDVNGEEIGRIIIEPNKPMRFEGEAEESAEVFFKHLKKRIDNFLL